MDKILIDTNLIIDDENILFKLKDKYEKIVIPITVLKELDKLKNKPETSFSARKAIRSIRHFQDTFPEKIHLHVNDNLFDINDTKIINAAKDNNAIIATKDISMSVIANSMGVETKLYDMVLNNIYRPYTKVDSVDFNSAFEKMCGKCFSFDQQVKGELYKQIHKTLDVLKMSMSMDGWGFLFFIDRVYDREYVYAHNPIDHCFDRIDNNSRYYSLIVKDPSPAELKALDIYQVCAIYALMNAPNVLLMGTWGSGKSLLATAYSLRSKNKVFLTRAPVGINKKYDLGFMPGPQPLYSKILTPTGWTTMGEIKAGDYVIGSDGKSTKVNKVLDVGVKPVYKIKTTNGGITYACGDHLWATKTHNELKHNKDFKDRSTLEIKEQIINPNKGPKYNISIPQNNIVEFDNKEPLPIPPYTLGALLGDGSFSNAISITNSDTEIIDRISNELLEYDLYLRKNGIQYAICGRYFNSKPAKPVILTDIQQDVIVEFKSVYEASLKLGVNRTTINSRCVKNIKIDNIKYDFGKAKRWRNYIKDSIFNLGLEKTTAYTKFIPDIYKYSSIEDRIALLQGLMDTDGTIKKTTGEQSFTTTSKKLAQDIIELCRSLGINATYYNRDRIGKKSICNNKEIITKCITYEISIPKNNSIVPFYTSRKRNRCRQVVKTSTIKIKSIDYVGNEYVKCIQIENKNNLYITDDYIVTHNSKNDKMLDWVSGVLSSLYFIFANTRGQNDKGMSYDFVKDDLFSDKFDPIPINSIQGLSLLDKDILMVDEVQLLDVDTMSMILSRPSKKGKLILLGDLGQTYSIVKPSESGLLKLLRILPHQSIACVELQKTFRGSIVELADKLQDKTIG